MSIFTSLSGFFSVHYLPGDLLPMPMVYNSAAVSAQGVVGGPGPGPEEVGCPDPGPGGVQAQLIQCLGGRGLKGRGSGDPLHVCIQQQNALEAF